MNAYLRDFIFLAFLFLVLLAWLLYIEFAASLETLKLITKYQLDKAVHIIGGIFVTGVLYALAGLRNRVLLVFLFVSIVVGWEVFELVFDPKVASFFAKHSLYWAEDTAGDFLFGGFGAWLYYRFLKTRKPPV